MTTVTELTSILQHLLTSKANELAKSSGFIQRQRQVTGAGFAQTLVLGGLAQPDATQKQMQQQAVQAGMRLSTQGLDQRFSVQAGEFMQRLLESTLTTVVQSEIQPVVMPQFNGIYISDCTRLPWSEQALKLGLRFELQRGLLSACLMPSTQNDQKAAVVAEPLPSGALHLGDLGFFKLERFRAMNAAGVYWLTRYKVGTRLWTSDGQALDLKTLLSGTAALQLDVIVGSGKRALKARLIAAPLTATALQKRTARLNEQARLDQRPLSQQQTDLMQWTIYLTNCPALDFEQAAILARTRWQIELIFKLWKSHGAILRSRSAEPLRRFAEGVGKLIGVLIAHWALLVSGWELDRVSRLDALRILRTHVPLLQRAFTVATFFAEFFGAVRYDLSQAPRPSRRKKTPLAFQLWYHFDDTFA